MLLSYLCSLYADRYEDVLYLETDIETCIIDKDLKDFIQQSTWPRQVIWIYLLNQKPYTLSQGNQKPVCRNAVREEINLKYRLYQVPLSLSLSLFLIYEGSGNQCLHFVL